MLCRAPYQRARPAPVSRGLDRHGTLDKATAYERLDGAGPRDYVYRLTLSPHPERQDAGQRLDLREWGRAMMARLETVSGQRLEWFAVTHAHVEHRHVHVVARSRGHFAPAHFQAMREVGDQQARQQQRHLAREQPTDRARGQDDATASTRELLTRRRQPTASDGVRAGRRAHDVELERDLGLRIRGRR